MSHLTASVPWPGRSWTNRISREVTCKRLLSIEHGAYAVRFERWARRDGKCGMNLKGEEANNAASNPTNGSGPSDHWRLQYIKKLSGYGRCD